MNSCEKILMVQQKSNPRQVCEIPQLFLIEIVFYTLNNWRASFGVMAGESDGCWLVNSSAKLLVSVSLDTVGMIGGVTFLCARRSHTILYNTKTQVSMHTHAHTHTYAYLSHRHIDRQTDRHTHTHKVFVD